MYWSALTNCPLKSHSPPPLLPSSPPSAVFSSVLVFFRTASAFLLLLFFILSLLLCLLLSFPHILTASSLYSHRFSCCLYLVGVYKRQEARLMLLLYQMRAVAHSSLSRITDETWAMDGFVSIHRNLKQLASDLLKITKSCDCYFIRLVYLFFLLQPDRHTEYHRQWDCYYLGGENKPSLN